MRVARLVPFALVVCGCALHHVAPGSRDPDVITWAEISASNETTILGVIQKLHAEYLRDRGQVGIASGSRDVPVVFLNDQEYGAISTLGEFPAHDIEQVRFYPWHDALIKFGRKYGGGVIQLITRVD